MRTSFDSAQEPPSDSPLYGENSCETVRQLMIKAFQSVVDWEGDVPGTTPDSCGNYLLHDLPMAKWEAKRYVERLKNDFHCVYPGL